MSFFNKKKEVALISPETTRATSYYADAFHRLRRNKAALFCLAVIVVLIFVALFGQYITPYDPNDQSVGGSLEQPSMSHLLGTDDYGRDIFSRVILGTKISLTIGICAQVLATIIGVFLGSVAGYYGGWVDTIISRIMEIFSAFPDLIFAMGIMFVIGPGIQNLFITLALLSWVTTARLIRGQILQLKQSEYVEACKATGGTSYRIITKHLIPNCISTIIVLVTLGIPNAIMAEAALSYLGLGVETPIPSWGSMISAAQFYIERNPIYSVAPGVAIIITVIAFNIFGDGLRDALDPKLKNQ